MCFAAAAPIVYLSSLDLSQLTTGWGKPRADKSVDGNPLSIAGRKFDHGVGTHSVSNFRLDLATNATSFTAVVGVDDDVGARGWVEFTVIGDAKTLCRNGLRKGGDAPVPLQVSMASVRVLHLRVTDGGDGVSYDHADRADAWILCHENAALPMPLPLVKTITVSTRNLTLNFEIGEGDRLYQKPLGTSHHRRQCTDEAYSTSSGPPTTPTRSSAWRCNGITPVSSPP